MTRSLSRIVGASLIGVALVGMIAIAPASAASPAAVAIVSPMTFNDDGFNFGTFEASGPAVDEGLICEAGTVDDTRIIFVGFQSNRGAQIPVRKTFTCDDGEIFIKIQVHLDFASSTESFSWVVLGGTGAYANVRGSGLGTTTPDGSDPQTGNINTYTGFLLG